MAVAQRLWDGTRRRGVWEIEGVDYEFHQCGTCGIVWAMPKDFLDARRDDHKSWLCPNGHSFVYSGPSELEKAKAELERTRDREARLTSQLDQAQASRRALKGQVTKARKQLARVEAGVCPHCRRSFQNVARHMETCHR